MLIIRLQRARHTVVHERLLAPPQRLQPCSPPKERLCRAAVQTVRSMVKISGNNMSILQVPPVPINKQHWKKTGTQLFEDEYPGILGTTTHTKYYSSTVRVRLSVFSHLRRAVAQDRDRMGCTIHRLGELFEFQLSHRSVQPHRCHRI